MDFQINLATRYKPVTPAVQYPPAKTAPPKFTTNRRFFDSVLANSGRPASADIGQLRRARKPQFYASADDVKSTSRCHSSASSSNILRLLLSETIPRQGNKQTSSEISMDETETQSEEECPEEIEVEQEIEETHALQSNRTQSSSASSVAVPRSGNRATAWAAKAKEIVNESTKEEQPDLPGRVSFSSNVFEIDFSDLSDDSRVDRNPHSGEKVKKLVHFENPSNNTLETNMNYSDKPDSSTKIIEDYKKEIQSLNRRHEEEMTKLNSEQNEMLSLNAADMVDSSKNCIIDSYLETIKEVDSLEVFEQLENEMLRDEEPPDLSTPKEMALQRTVTITWDTSQRTDERICSSSSDGKAEDDEYAETETQSDVRPIETTKEEKKPRINVKKPVKNILRRPKTPQSSKVASVKPHITPDPKIRKTKSASNLKDDCHLRDFQMDKVDSWMSMNKEQECYSSNLMAMKRQQSCKEWRDTPTSKTDDEGNFSLEEANDCLSNESTTYEELVSIIKEIEADKGKAKDRKALQADVDFKLKTALSDDDLKDHHPPTSDPVK